MDLDSVCNCRYLVIGDPVAHSRSPEMQNAGLEALGLGRVYGKLRVMADEIGDFVAWARLHLDGFNITVPHKERIIPFLDERDPVAELAGSFNTVSCRGGKLIGCSTDGYGLENAVQEAFQLPLAGQRVLFLGTGGAACATAFRFASRGVAHLMLVNRTKAKADELAARLRVAYPELPVDVAVPGDEAALREMIGSATLLIQATSLGLKDGDPLPMNPDLLLDRPDLPVFDTIYRPTPLLRFAEAHGMPAADGRWMLLHQGARSMEIWTGKQPPVAQMRAALERSLQA